MQEVERILREEVEDYFGRGRVGKSDINRQREKVFINITGKASSRPILRISVEIEEEHRQPEGPGPEPEGSNKLDLMIRVQKMGASGRPIARRLTPGEPYPAKSQFRRRLQMVFDENNLRKELMRAMRESEGQEQAKQLRKIPQDMLNQLDRLGLSIDSIPVSGSNLDWQVIDQETGQPRSPEFHSQDQLFDWLKQEYGLDVNTPPEMALASRSMGNRQADKLFTEILQGDVDPKQAIMEAVETTNEGRCPVTNEPYGGLPANGGFSPITEFIIGASNIAEAVHCILGSLSKGINQANNRGDVDILSGLGVEVGHLREEMGIITDAMDEYSRTIYRDPDHTMHSPEETAEEIREQAPKLRQRAQQKKQSVDTGYDQIDSIAYQCYDVIIALTNALEESINEGSGQFPFGDPYSDPVLRGHVEELERMIQNLTSKVESQNERFHWDGD